MENETGTIDVVVKDALACYDKIINQNGAIQGLKKHSGHHVKVVILNKKKKEVNTTEEMNHE